MNNPSAQGRYAAIRDWLAQNPGATNCEAAKHFGTTETSVRRARKAAPTPGKPHVSAEYTDTMGRLQITSDKPISIKDALAFAAFDADKWKVKKVRTGGHQVPMRVRQGQAEGQPPRWLPDEPIKVWCTVWSVELEPKPLDFRMGEELLAELRKEAPKARAPRRIKPRKGKPRYALEIDMPDVHIGLRCFTPGSDVGYSTDEAVALVRAARDDLLREAQARYGEFEEVLWFFGHDWVEVLAEVAPVKVLVIPGNHDRVVAFTLGQLLDARFHNDDRVTVDASASPYKFWRWGVNLIGGEHGHSANVHALAALMANEARHLDFAGAEFREWHLGDQHRKSAARPTVKSEQGVSVEYLQGLTPPNEWHRIKAFNHQLRGAVAFVYDYSRGPRARLTVNVRRGENRLL